MATHSICSIDGCGKPVARRDLCNAHYMRWKRYGDPLGGGPERGLAQRFYREVVLAYDGNECLVWPHSRGADGYGRLGWRVVSRLVCEHFNGPPPTPDHEAAHHCGKGHEGCCTKRHLDWKTRVGNRADRTTHGTDDRGERHSLAKLTTGQVLEIKALKGKAIQRDVAARFGVSRQTIYSIQSGRNWSWL